MGMGAAGDAQRAPWTFRPSLAAPPAPTPHLNVFITSLASVARTPKLHIKNLFSYSSLHHSLECVHHLLGLGSEGHGGRDEGPLALQLLGQPGHALVLVPLPKAAQPQVPAVRGSERR